ncbi:8466_t:CDS:2, partial [Cetraspora pellucida]
MVLLLDLSLEYATPFEIIQIENRKHDKVVVFQDPSRRNKEIKRIIYFDQYYDISPWCD